jgi:hypothetical protein
MCTHQVRIKTVIHRLGSLDEEPESEFEKFQKCHMNIPLGCFNAKVWKEDTFKSTIMNESLHEISNDNGVRVVNIATSKTLIFKSSVFPIATFINTPGLLQMGAYKIRFITS